MLMTNTRICSATLTLCLVACEGGHGRAGADLAAGSGSPDLATGSGSPDLAAAGSPDLTVVGGGDLYPLATGYRWTYQVTAVGPGAVCGAGQYAAKVLGSGMHDGKLAYQVTSFCSGSPGSEWIAASGDQAYLDYQGTWLEFIAPPLQDGATFTYFNTSYTWHRESAVTVPAGRFTDCWTARQNVSYTAFLTYCRGVGTTRSYSQDLTGSGWDAQLLSKSF